MRTIFILKGIPASGKSTWAKQQLKQYPDHFKRVNKDLLRTMIDDSAFSVPKENFILSIQNFVIRIALNKGFDVIVDDTNFNEKHWFRICDIAKQVGDVQIIEKYFPIDLKEALKRNLNREQSVPEEVIHNMFKKNVEGKSVKERKEYFSPVSKPEVLEAQWAIVVDIDGTLAFNDGHRDYFDYTKVLDDKPIEEIIELVQFFEAREYTIILVSGREDSCKEDTETWLENYGVSYDILFMRKEGDHRKDFVIKKEIYEEYIKDIWNIRFVLDDRNQIVEMWRGLGIKVLQVADGNF